MSTETQRSVRKEQSGVVISDKMHKTIVVQTERRIRHAQYGKEITRTKKYYAHDEKNEAKVGDTVRIMESRPMSRLKRWRLVAVVSKAAK